MIERGKRHAGRRTIWLLGGASAIVSALVLALLFAVSDRDAPTQERQLEEVIDLLADTKDVDRGTGRDAGDLGITLPEGGWVQKTGSDGQLEQQYRCDSLDPDPPGLPDGWIEMGLPEVELFLSDDRVVTIRGDRAIANAPKRILESGEIAGHVVIRLFETQGRRVDPDFDEPAMVMTTPQASFDNFLGEITCEGDVQIVTQTEEITGRHLTLRFNDRDERIEYLQLAELDQVLLYPEAADRSSPQMPKMRPAARRRSLDRTRGRLVSAEAIASPTQHYIITLLDDVQVQQGELGSGRTARGDRLTIAFSMESDAVSRSSRAGFGGIQSIIITSAIAAVETPLDQSPVRITCQGGLTMVPLDDSSLMPTSPTDTRVELFGSPVTVRDGGESFSASAAMLQYEVQQDRVDLHADTTYPAQLHSDELRASGEHLWLARAEGRGGFNGPGDMELRQSGGKESGAPPVDMVITWEQGVDLSFAPGAGRSDSPLERVICRGDVALKSDTGSVDCTELDVHFQQGADGSSVPKLAIATGDVKAINGGQTLWANRAEVSFLEDNDAPADDTSPLGGQLRADRMSATGDVQVLLSDGGRAFCDALQGDAGQEAAVLQGDVVIAYERMLIDRGEKATLHLDRSAGTGNWSGAGQARFLQDAIDVSSDHRIDRPVLSKEEDEPIHQQVTLRANWESSMAIDSMFNDEAGALDLEGNVIVQSRRSPLDLSAMQGDDLRLEFANLPTDPEDDSPRRRLDHLIARGDAKIEHRLWETAAHEGKPVVYYVAGQHVEFEEPTGEAIVVGDGELVLRDPRPLEMSDHRSPLAGRGTTRFTWTGELQTIRIDDRLYRIEMEGDVEMLHKGLDGSVGMLTADRMEALAVDVQPYSPASRRGEANLALAGMDLKQLIADGSVYVATPTRRIDCDNFDYDLRTGVASVVAKPNRTVSVVTEGSPYPVRARSVIWNMDPSIDTITIQDLRGTGPGRM